MLGIAFQIRTQIATARLRCATSENTRPFDAFFTRATSALTQIRCRQTSVVDTTQRLATLVFFYTRNPLKRRARWEAMNLDRGQKQQTQQNQWPMKYSTLHIHDQTNPPSARVQQHKRTTSRQITLLSRYVRYASKVPRAQQDPQQPILPAFRFMR